MTPASEQAEQKRLRIAYAQDHLTYLRSDLHWFQVQLDTYGGLVHQYTASIERLEALIEHYEQEVAA